MQASALATSQPGTVAFTPMADCSVDGARDIDFRQLRHQTKNALQRILSIIAQAPEFQAARGGLVLRESLQERILMAAAVSDALFGLTRNPGSLQDRLVRLSFELVELLAEQAAEIDVDVSVEGFCPEAVHTIVVRVAHELIGNAIKHGMHQRLRGNVTIRVRTTADHTTLTVCDNGWGCAPAAPTPGEGLSIVYLLLQRHGGALLLERHGQRTTATARIPHTTGGL